MEYDQSFTGMCPTCGQPYYAVKIERLRAALKAIIQDKTVGKVSEASWRFAIDVLRDD